jgi:hypothetical protein
MTGGGCIPVHKHTHTHTQYLFARNARTEREGGGGGQGGRGRASSSRLSLLSHLRSRRRIHGRQIGDEYPRERNHESAGNQDGHEHLTGKKNIIIFQQK